MAKEYVLDKGDFRLIWRPMYESDGTAAAHMEVVFCKRNRKTGTWEKDWEKPTRFPVDAPDELHRLVTNLLMAKIGQRDASMNDIFHTISVLSDETYKALLIPQCRQVKQICKTTLEVDPALLKVIDQYLHADTPDKYQDEDHTISCTATFLDGRQMDIKCCGSQSGPSWTEAVLFDQYGEELCMSDPEEEFDGEWSLECDGITYEVNVVPMRSLEAAGARSYRPIPFPLNSKVCFENTSGEIGTVIGYLEDADDLMIQIQIGKAQITGVISQIEHGDSAGCYISKIIEPVKTKVHLVPADDGEQPGAEYRDFSMFVPCSIGVSVRKRADGTEGTVTGFRYRNNNTEVLVEFPDGPQYCSHASLEFIL